MRNHILCKKTSYGHYEKGKYYKYRTISKKTLEIQAEDTYFYKIDMRGVKDYFFTKSEWRKIKINKILKKCQT